MPVAAGSGQGERVANKALTFTWTDSRRIPGEGPGSTLLSQPERPLSGKAKAGQVIWRLGCIKAIYKSLKGFTPLHHTLCSFIQPGTGLSGSSDPLNQRERLIKKVAFTAFVVVVEGKGALLRVAADAW